MEKSKEVFASDAGSNVPFQHDTTAEKQPLPSRKTPGFLFVLTFFATLGGFLVGYDIGIVSGSMLYVQPHFDLQTLWTEAIVSGAVGAAAVSSLLGGWLADKIGRRLILLIGSVIFSVGGIVMGSAPSQEALLVGRIICGLGMGLASVVVPIYMAEASPVYIRGRLTSMWQMLINTGIIVSSIIAGAFSYLPESVNWRYMLGLSAVPGVVQFIGFLFLPESPRWLVDKGRVEEARQVLVRMRGYSDVSDELKNIEKSVQEARANTMSGYKQLIQIVKTSYVRRALVVGMGLLFFQQWCGINTAIYYSGTVFKMAGFPVSAAVWLVVIPNALLFVAGCIGMFVVDRIGRRPLIIWSMVGTALGLIVIAVGFQLSSEHAPFLNSTLVESYDNQTYLHSPCLRAYKSCDTCIKDEKCGFCSDGTSGTCLPVRHDSEEISLYGRCNDSSAMNIIGLKFTKDYCPSDYSWVTLLGVALFVCLFAPGMAAMPWTINAEIYPLWARGTCTSLAATTSWCSNLIISFTFLNLTEAITVYGAFWFFTGFSLVGLLFFVVFLPETKNRNLEEVEELFMSASELEHRRAAAAETVKTSPNNMESDIFHTKL